METGVVTCFLVGVVMTSSPPLTPGAVEPEGDPKFAPFVVVDPLDRGPWGPGGEVEEDFFLLVVAVGFAQPRPLLAFFPGRVLNSSSSPSSSILFVPRVAAYDHTYIFRCHTKVYKHEEQDFGYEFYRQKL